MLILKGQQQTTPHNRLDGLLTSTLPQKTNVINSTHSVKLHCATTPRQTKTIILYKFGTRKKKSTSWQVRGNNANMLVLRKFPFDTYHPPSINGAPALYFSKVRGIRRSHGPSAFQNWRRRFKKMPTTSDLVKDL